MRRVGRPRTATPTDGTLRWRRWRSYQLGIAPSSDGLACYNYGDALRALQKAGKETTPALVRAVRDAMNRAVGHHRHPRHRVMKEVGACPMLADQVAWIESWRAER